MNTRQRWEKLSDGVHYSFDKVLNKRSQRADLHAFLLLDGLFPSQMEMVSAAEHDEIYLGVTKEQIDSLTDEQIVELSRCGVRYDASDECLCMFT